MVALVSLMTEEGMWALNTVAALVVMKVAAELPRVGCESR